MRKKRTFREKGPEIPIYKLWEDPPTVLKPEEIIPKEKQDCQIQKVKQ